MGNQWRANQSGFFRGGDSEINSRMKTREGKIKVEGATEACQELGGFQEEQLGVDAKAGWGSREF